MDHFDGLCLKEHKKHEIYWGSTTFQDIDYADDLNILDESVSKMNELLEILRVQSARIGSKINAKKTKSLGLGISEKKKVTLDNKKNRSSGQLHLH